jgi:hypothetical protein
VRRGRRGGPRLGTGIHHTRLCHMDPELGLIALGDFVLLGILLSIDL